MSTGSEIAAAKLVWAAGYHTVEYYIVQMKPSDLVIAETRHVHLPGGRPSAKMRQSDLDWLMRRAQRDPDGTYRVSVSKAAPGRPVGRISYHGTRSDDPNDLVPHENRRELRGWRVFAAWLNHVDAKSIQSLDALVKDGDLSYVRHYMLDFSSTLGAGSTHARDYFEGYEGGRSSRSARSASAPCPWGSGSRMADGRVRRHAGGRAASSVDHTDWDPDLWQSRFPNAAFLRAREDDKFWAARKLAAITPAMIAAALREGQFDDERGVQAPADVPRGAAGDHPEEVPAGHQPGRESGAGRERAC